MSTNSQCSPPGFSCSLNDSQFSYSMGYEVCPPQVSLSPTYAPQDGSDSSDHSGNEYNTVKNTLRPSCNSFPNNQAQAQMLLGQRFRDTHSTSDSILQGSYSQYDHSLLLSLYRSPIPYNMSNDYNSPQFNGESFRSYSSSEEFLPEYFQQPIEVAQYSYYTTTAAPQPKMNQQQQQYRHSPHQQQQQQQQYIQQQQQQSHYQYQQQQQQQQYQQYITQQQYSPQQIVPTPPIAPPPGMHLPQQIIHKRNPGLPPAAPLNNNGNCNGNNNQYYDMRNVVNGMNRMVLHTPPPPIMAPGQLQQQQQQQFPMPPQLSSLSPSPTSSNSSPVVGSNLIKPTKWCEVNKYNPALTSSPPSLTPNMLPQPQLPISPPSPMLLSQQYSGSSTTSVNSNGNNNNNNNNNSCISSSNISPTGSISIVNNNNNNNSNESTSTSVSSSASSSGSTNLHVASIINGEKDDENNGNIGNNTINNNNSIVNVLKWLPKNQQNCRILQTKIEEDPVNNLSKVLNALEDHYEEIIVDPFGNYLFQKVFDFITDPDEITSILNKIKPHFIASATNLHGSRSMQRLVKSCTTNEQFEIIIDCLRPHIESLCQDPHGNHVLQLCLGIFPPNMTEFIYNIIEQNIGAISITKFGCYVVQKAYEVADNDRKSKLAKALIANTKDIIGNQYGNYALQYILENGAIEYSYDVVKTIKGSIIKLCMQKYSSNVLEKLIQTKDYKIQIEIVNELVRYPKHLTTVIQHRFGIYVVRRLLTTLLPEILPVFKKAFQPIYESLKDNSKFKKNIQVLSTIPEFSVNEGK